MKQLVLISMLCLAATPTALAWNSTGHCIVAFLAYQSMPEEQRHEAIEILRAHPHYTEYLSRDRLAGYSEEEWIFLRASTWPDWIRRGERREYNRPEWHYINQPFVPAGSRVPPPDANTPNIVTQLAVCQEGLARGTAADRAVNLCWLLHLVGDVHQPLHCVTLVDEEFPRGDQGGNLALVRIGNNRHHVKLHAMWDDLLGSKPTRSTLERVVGEINAFDEEKRAKLQAAVADHRGPQEWAQESFAIAVEYAYLGGRLPLANGSYDPAEEQIPEVPEDYARQAGAIARLQVAKAGERLKMLLGESLP